MDMTIVYGVGMFTAIVLALVMVILAARSRLVSSGNVSIEIMVEKLLRCLRVGSYSRPLLMRICSWRVPVAAVALVLSASAR